jgi:acyl transferase domain-containing protein/NAD(P)H-dependent flavin oxidoreductase YrpB (nitropropane dioxygenase family)
MPVEATFSMPDESILRDLVIAISPCGELEPSPHIATQAWRGGGLGVVDLADGGWRSLRALAQGAATQTPLGVRVPLGCAATEAEVQRAGGGRVELTILPAGSPWEVTEAASWSRVLAEVHSKEQARAAAANGAHGVIARGMESGGLVSDLSTFVLLQQLLGDDSLTLPVWAAGGIGLHTAAACVVGGAAGVVLDSQLGLMPESDLPGDVMRVLRRMDGSETVVSGGLRGVKVTGSPRRLVGPRDPEDQLSLLPIGQDGHLAGLFAAAWRDTAAAVRGLRAAILETVADGVPGHALAPGAPLAAALGVRIPVAQGPMTRVSDQAGFAAAVAADGAMPFIALALADGERSRRMLREAAEAVGERPWGVGVLGFAPEELRTAQLAAVHEVKPTWAIVAGGRPAQAKELEQVGIATFLHVPSPGLLRQFLRSGVRRYVFEGAECGGHIGPRASFPLWEAQIAAIGEFLDTAPAEAGSELQVLFAGGVNDARSGAMVAALAAPLTRRGAKIGVLMGTAYLFTEEAVEHGAIMPLFQRMAVEAVETACLETAPGHVTRALRTSFCDEFERQRAELEAAGTESREIWMHLELLNTGRLRLASKGLEHDGSQVGEVTQAAEGLYMAGQVAVLRDAVTTVPALHAEVTTGASDFHDQRLDQLRQVLGITLAQAGEPGEPAGPLDIAIVGMAGMFAKSPDMDAFWRTIISGKDAFTEVSPERWDPGIYYTAEAMGTSGRTTVSKWGGFIEPVPIDPIRYGIPPSALGSVDPCQLLALEVANQALADAGYAYDAPGADHSRTGVVFGAEAGSDNGGALAVRVMLPAFLGEVPAELDQQLPTFTEDTFPGNLPNVIAGRIANRFDFGGTNFTVDAACAASLAALDVACKQLSTQDADMMLCGAVDLHNGIGDFLMFGSVFALSPSGRVATFDAGADGTALGEGVGCVVLKRLADAQRDGDRVYAVIKGMGAASDGRARSLTAPRVEGQVLAMQRAYRQAGISPGQVELIEAHGTGTGLGDQVELSSLQQVFNEAGAEPGGCVLGSVKSQIGHAKCAAGLAGLIKTVLAVHYGVQTPTSNLVRPNELWQGEKSPFAFLSEPRPWLTDKAERVAGLSAFGFGGTNFHVVLAGDPSTPEPRHAVTAWPAELFCFRGTDREAAYRAVRNLASTLDTAAARPGGVRLRDLAARAAADAEAAGGPAHVAVVATDPADLAELLRRALAGEHDPVAGLIQPPPAESKERPPVAFLFPGQGSQRPAALSELFVAFPELRQYLRLGQRWAGTMFPPMAFDPAREREHSELLRRTETAQPALGICGLAVDHLLGRLGLRPDMAGGHSYGELVALATAGAFDPETLLDLSEARASAMLSAAGGDPGAMVAVSSTADKITEVLASRKLADVTLANLNAPGQVVISGPAAAIDSAFTALREEGLPARRLPVACAFHSPVVAAASDQFAKSLAARQLAAPRWPVWSNRTAAPHAPDAESIRAEMAAQISSPVRFSDQIEAMYDAGARVFIEAGPGKVLTGLVRSVLGDRPHLAVASDGPQGSGLRRFLVALGEIACAGVPLNVSWLFQGRETADPAAPPTDNRPRWLATGAFIRDANGVFPPGALTPARMIKEFPVASTNGNGNGSHAATPDTMLAEYLRASREMVSAQRDVMLAFLGGAPGGRLVWQGEPATLTDTGAPYQPATVTAVVEPTAPAGAPAGGQPAAAPAAPPTGAALQETLVSLISERTGYPVELIEPDLDLEADLSIDSIKRAEIAGEVATQLGMSLEGGDESVLEDLVKARTVTAIMAWLDQQTGENADANGAAPGGAAAGTHEAAGATAAAGEAGDAASGRTEAAAAPAPAAGQDDGEEVLAGATPLRVLPRLVQLEPTSEPPGSVAGARFVVTGGTPVANQLASQLRKLGAEVTTGSMDAIAADDIRDADGLIFLDGLRKATDSLPPAMFPLIKDALTSGNGTPGGQRWLLAAGTASKPDAFGLAGLFRVIGTEYPDRFARYVELDKVTPAKDAAAKLLGELVTDTSEPAVTYTSEGRFRIELAPAELAGAPNGAGPAGSGTSEAQAMGLNSDSVVVLIGGARGITASFARELAAASRCRIELVGRTQLAGEPLSPDVEAAAGAVALRSALARQGMRNPAEIQRATREILARREVSATISELRELGSQVRYHAADAQDAAAIKQVFQLVHADHGRIDGVVYAAGIIEDKLIADKDPESFRRVFRTKVGGAQVVLDAVAGRQCSPAFVVLYGSISAAFGSRGQADYAAANDALENIGAAWAASTGHRCITVHWGPWAPDQTHPGMVTPELGREYAKRGIGMIDPQQGALSLLKELAWGDPGLSSVVYSGAVPDAG